MFNCLNFGSDVETNDEESLDEILVDLSQSRWIIDLDIDNIITRISENKTWADSMRERWQAMKGNGQDQQPRELEQSYRINLAVLQRMYLEQLREKLVKHAAALRFEAEEPAEWQKTLGEYIQALQNYDYMERRSLHPEDPFYVSGEKYLDRKLLEHVIGDEGDRLGDQKMFRAMGKWQKHPAGPEFVGDTRRDNYRRSWTKGFHQRLGVAALGGIFLIAPMWLMVLHNTLYTALVSTTAFVVAFGLMAAIFLTSLMEVMSSTAAYAAVLVVFVGLTTESTRGS